jgi:hypothetical protein
MKRPLIILETFLTSLGSIGLVWFLARGFWYEEFIYSLLVYLLILLADLLELFLLLLGCFYYTKPLLYREKNLMQAKKFLLNNSFTIHFSNSYTCIEK